MAWEDVNAPESITARKRTDTGPVPPPVPADDLTVGKVASLVGVSVRTLHHWDSIRLVQPGDRTPTGYRTYSSTDVERVHRVLVYRELGFSLAEIGKLLDDPEVDETDQLRQQRRHLDERIDRLREMAAAVDQILQAHADGRRLTPAEQAEIFGTGWREDWAEEAHQRWGDSPQWAQFDERSAEFSEADRERMRTEGEAIQAELVAAKRAGVEPGTDEANRLAEKHRAMIGQLYDCTHSMHVCLGNLYVGDERFVAYFDEREPGLSLWLSRIIDANARAYGVDPENAVWE